MAAGKVPTRRRRGDAGFSPVKDVGADLYASSRNASIRAIEFAVTTAGLLPFEDPRRNHAGAATQCCSGKDGRSIG